MLGQCAIVVLSEDEGAVRVWSRWARRFALDVRTAPRRLAEGAVSEDCACVVVDVDPPHRDTGFELIDGLAGAKRRVTIVAMGGLDAGALRRAQDRGIVYVCKPLAAPMVFAVLDRLEPDGRTTPDPVADARAAFGWTKRHGEVARVAALVSADHPVVCKTLRITDNTLKSYVREMLRRARARGSRAMNLEELVAPIRAAMR